MVETEGNCPICLESLSSHHGHQTLSCGHVLHELCVLNMRRFGTSGQCPLCRIVCDDIISVTELFERAGLCHARRQHAEVATLLQEILIIDPTHAAACLNLGMMFHEGKGVDQNIGKAIELYETAHTEGNTDATRNLAVMYHQGDGFEQNSVKAAELYEQAHLGGKAEATCNLGIMYQMGDGVTQDLAKAKAMFELGVEAGLALSAQNLGTMYFMGQGVQRDYARAKELFHKTLLLAGINSFSTSALDLLVGKNKEIYDQSIEKGASLAAGKLGIMYSQGLGVQRDHAVAKPCLQYAYDFGNKNAAYDLAVCYLNGFGCEVDLQQAHQLLEEAHDAGQVAASRLLGCRYRKGLGVAKNPTKAKNFFEAAINAGDALAAAFLGDMFVEGTGIPRSFCRAKELFEIAHDSGCYQGTRGLAELHEGGFGVEANLPKAYTLYQQAAAAGCPASPVKLASWGTPKQDSAEMAEHMQKVMRLQKALEPPSLPVACATCGSRSKRRLLCVGCRRVYYCSTTCQRRAWPAHKIACGRTLADHEPAHVSNQAIQDEPNKSVHEMLVTEANEADAEVDSACMQAAVAASLSEMKTQMTMESNAQVCEEIFRNRFIPDGVWLLQFSRDPDSFHRTLLECPELHACREELRASGFNPVLPSNAKIFVRPDIYQITLQAVHDQGLSLEPRHVLVSSEFENVVRTVVKPCGRQESPRVKGRDKVRCNSREPVSLGISAIKVAAKEHSLNSVSIVSRTFIHVKIRSPNSLRSNPFSGPVTSSTTDARSDMYHGVSNPRLA